MYYPCLVLPYHLVRAVIHLESVLAQTRPGPPPGAAGMALAAGLAAGSRSGSGRCAPPVRRVLQPPEPVRRRPVRRHWPSARWRRTSPSRHRGARAGTMLAGAVIAGTVLAGTGRGTAGRRAPCARTTAACGGEQQRGQQAGAVPGSGEPAGRWAEDAWRIGELLQWATVEPDTTARANAGPPRSGAGAMPGRASHGENGARATAVDVVAPGGRKAARTGTMCVMRSLRRRAPLPALQ